MSQQVSFNFGNVQIRTTKDNQDNVWFVCKDIATALEYSTTSKSTVLFQSVPEEWKGIKQIDTPTCNQQSSIETGFNQFDRNESKRNTLCVTEQGLYFFVCRSDKPKALPFQKWVAGEVIPSIRKTGSYSVAKQEPAVQKLTVHELLENAAFLLDRAGIVGNQQVLALDKIHKVKTGESLLALANVQLVAPQNEHLYNPTELGAMLTPKMKGAEVNKKLKALGLQFDTRDSKNRIKWNPTPAGVEAGGVMLDVGKAHGTGEPIRHLHWSLKVLDYLK